MELFSNLMGDDPLPVRSILDNEDVLLERLLHSVNVPIRVKSQKDEYSKSLKFLKKTTLISVDNDILNFTNQTGLVFKCIKDYTKEFNIRGFESRSIHFNRILNNESLIDKIGTLYTNNLKVHINGELKNVNIIVKDIEGCCKPCIEIIDCNKNKELTLSNFNVSGSNSRLTIKTHNKLNFNNFHSNNINEIIITCNDVNFHGTLIKQLSQLFDNTYKYRVWDNNDMIIELQSKSLKDIISYYNSDSYNTYGVELPYKVNDVNLSDILNVSGIYNLENIIIKFGVSRLIITKNINLAKQYWNWKYRENINKGLCQPQMTKDGWYIAFSGFDKIKRRSY